METEVKNKLSCGCKNITPVNNIGITPDYLKLRFDSMRIPLEFFNHDEMKLFKIHGGLYKRGEENKVRDK